MIHPLLSMATLLATSLGGSAEHAGANPPAPPSPSTALEAAAQGTLYSIVDAGIVALSIAFLMCLWRLLRGPTLADRGLASDTISMQLVGIAILLTIRMRTIMFFDAVLIISILGFATTVAFAQYIARRRAV